MQQIAQFTQRPVVPQAQFVDMNEVDQQIAGS
jgi:hypothetical protein